MKLFEQGKFRLNDKITDYIPEFQGGKSGITIRNLFTHFSGLKPDVPLLPVWSGYETGIKLACTDPPDGPPGARYAATFGRLTTTSKPTTRTFSRSYGANAHIAPG